MCKTAHWSDVLILIQDEVDILRERSAKLENAQSTIDSMRRKVEEGTELRRQLRKLEEKNSQYIQQNLELEEVMYSLILKFNYTIN